MNKRKRNSNEEDIKEEDSQSNFPFYPSNPVSSIPSHYQRRDAVTLTENVSNINGNGSPLGRVASSTVDWKTLWLEADTQILAVYESPMPERNDRLRNALHLYNEAYMSFSSIAKIGLEQLWLLASIADVCYKLGEPLKSLEYLGLAFQLFPENANGEPFLHLRRGQCWFDLGDGLEALTNSFALDPSIRTSQSDLSNNTMIKSTSVDFKMDPVLSKLYQDHPEVKKLISTIGKFSVDDQLLPLRNGRYYHAANELTKALLTGGLLIFAHEDPKYLEWLLPQLKAPLYSTSWIGYPCPTSKHVGLPPWTRLHSYLTKRDLSFVSQLNLVQSEQKELDQKDYEKITQAIEEHKKAVHYENIGDLEKAISLYTNAVRLWPNFADALYRKAMVLGYMCQPPRPTEAFWELQKSMEIDKQFTDYGLDLLRLYVENWSGGGEDAPISLEAALAICTKLMEDNPFCPGLYFYRGTLMGLYYCLGGGDSEEGEELLSNALEYLDEGIKLDPLDYQLRALRADLISQQRSLGESSNMSQDEEEENDVVIDYSVAIFLYERFGKKTRTLNNPADNLTIYGNNSNNSNNKIQLGGKLSSVGGVGISDIYFNRANQLAKLGKFEYSLNDYTIVLNNLNPRDLGARKNRGIVYAQLGQWQSALDDFRECIKWLPTDLKGYVNCAKVYMEMQDYNLVIKEYAEALRVLQSNNDFVDDEIAAELWHLKAVAQARAERWKEALDDIDQVIGRIGDKFGGVCYGLRANILLKLGNPDKALDDINKALEIDSNDLDALHSRAEIYAVFGRFREALDDVRAIEDRDSGRGNALNSFKQQLLGNLMSQQQQSPQRISILS